jgi:hypothetical protein
MTTLPPELDSNPNHQNYALNHSVVLLSPNRGCWQCEKPLHIAPLAVVSGELILLVCSPDCVMTVSAELGSNGRSFRVTNPGETSAILRSATILGIVEGWLVANRRWYAFYDGTLARKRMRSLLEGQVQ